MRPFPTDSGFNAVKYTLARCGMVLLGSWGAVGSPCSIHRRVGDNHLKFLFLGVVPLHKQQQVVPAGRLQLLHQHLLDMGVRGILRKS